MGLFRKHKPETSSLEQRPTWMHDGLTVSVSEGPEDLEVVGESHYQENLWQIVGGRTWEPIRKDVVAILVPEPNNPYDPNAISVWVNGLKVGYLSRSDAARFLPGLYAMSQRDGAPIGMYGTVVGGGRRDDGLGMLGVFLRYDPDDFGLQPQPRRRRSSRATLTGVSEMVAGGRRLRWLERLPDDTLTAIQRLRGLLDEERDPLERHYMYCELERRLYRSRDTFASALSEYDELIRRHDAEMDTIRAAFLAESHQLPVFDTYKQAAIRHQKAKDYAGALWWVRRGLTLYGLDCARPEAVDDLRQREKKYQAKLSDAGA